MMIAPIAIQPGFLLLLILASLSVGVKNSVADEDWLAELRKWQQERDQKLRSPDGWLAVSGLHYLEDGTFSLGADPASDIRLPGQGVPPAVGRLTVTGSRAVLKCADGVQVQFNGKPVAQATLSIQGDAAEANGDDLVTIGSATLFMIRRAGMPAIRMKDTENPLLKNFPGEQRYPPNRQFVTTASFTPAVPGLLQTTINVRGDAFQEPVAGTLSFQLGGRQFKLTAVPDQDGRLFIVFRDLTTGQGTYGGGRFLSTEPVRDGQVVLDFNRAVNPPCAWNRWTTCPLPAKENALPLKIEAGAKLP